jgi:hypothetical protein
VRNRQSILNIALDYMCVALDEIAGCLLTVPASLFLFYGGRPKDHH